MESMTTTSPTLIDEIEAFLALTVSRETFAASEVQNFLLDLRGLLVSTADLN